MEYKSPAGQFSIKLLIVFVQIIGIFFEENGITSIVFSISLCFSLQYTHFLPELIKTKSPSIPNVTAGTRWAVVSTLATWQRMQDQRFPKEDSETEYIVKNSSCVVPI